MFYYISQIKNKQTNTTSQNWVYIDPIEKLVTKRVGTWEIEIILKLGEEITPQPVYTQKGYMILPLIENPLGYVAGEFAKGAILGLTHRKGVIHGDLHSEQWLYPYLEDPYLIDFGLATTLDILGEDEFYKRRLKEVFPNGKDNYEDSFLLGYESTFGRVF
jgi:serine/threonine protein kinase